MFLNPSENYDQEYNVSYHYGFHVSYRTKQGMAPWIGFIPSTVKSLGSKLITELDNWALQQNFDKEIANKISFTLRSVSLERFGAEQQLLRHIKSGFGTHYDTLKNPKPAP